MSHKNIRSFFLFPVFSAVLLFCLGLNSFAYSGDLPGLWSIGLEGGVNKLTEGYWDYSNLDKFGGITVGRSITPHWIGRLALRYGQIRPGIDTPESDAGWGFGSHTDLCTVMWQPEGMLQYRFAPQSRFCPTMSVGLGFTSWKVLDTNGEDTGIFASGDLVKGFDIHGEEKDLSGSDLTISLELGLDYYVTESIALSVGGRYHLMPGNELDNVGLSNLWGEDHVDANTAMAQGFLGVTMWLGNTDWDKDGIPNKADNCPTVAEDFDGFQDDDGCPEVDNDGDKIIDSRDKCPDEPEDIDGFQDQDGCPDADNDGDGVLDGVDQCPESPAGTTVDLSGCPVQPEEPTPELPIVETEAQVPQEAIVPAVLAVPAVAAGTASVVYAEDSDVLTGVAFRSGSAQLTTESITILAEVAAQLRAAPEDRFEIRGHTDSVGNPENNRDLSLQRAISVRDSLIQMGIQASRLTAVGYGEDFPLESNATAEGRIRNRRVELHKLN